MATRQRRTPQAAKFAILEAAERRLHDEGPEGVRIQRIASDLGITDAAVHYHFGTREALMDAFLRRIGRRLVDDIEATIESWAPDQIDVAALGRLFQRAYANERAARLALWLSLAGWRPKGSGMLKSLVERVHRARVEAARKATRAAPRKSDTQYAIALLSAAHIHAAMSGEALLASVAEDPSSLDQRGFLNFAVDLIARDQQVEPDSSGSLQLSVSPSNRRRAPTCGHGSGLSARAELLLRVTRSRRARSGTPMILQGPNPF